MAFHITQGIAIRVVNFLPPIELPGAFTTSAADGTISHTIEADLRGLPAPDGLVRISVTATDGTLDPENVTDVVWSNALPFAFLKLPE